MGRHEYNTLQKLLSITYIGESMVHSVQRVCYTLLFLFITTAHSSLNQPLNLESDGNGRTTHPVLFVHGRFNPAEKTWGVELANKSCINPTAHNIGAEWQNVIGHDIPLTNEVMCFLTVNLKVDIKSEDGRRFLNIRSEQIIVDSTKKPKQAGDNPFAGSTVSFDQNSTSVTVHYGSKNKTVSAEGVLIDLLGKWQFKDISMHEWVGKKGDFYESYPNPLDHVSYYQEGTIPDILAKELNLKRDFSNSDISHSDNWGINHNGLYFYNAKTPQISIGNVSTCINPKLNNIIVETKVFSTPLDANFNTKTLKSRLKFEVLSDDGRIFPNQYTEYSIIDSKQWNINDPSNAFVINDKYFDDQNNTVTIEFNNTQSSQINYTNTFSTIVDEWKTKDVTNIPWIGDFTGAEIKKVEYQGNLIEDWRIEPTANAYFNQDTIVDHRAVYGQPNQLYDRMVFVLNDFYGKGMWENDPTAKIDLMGFSQGGTTIRYAVHKFREPSLSNPVNHINRIITSNTPHFGSAVATLSENLHLPHPESGEDYSDIIPVKEELKGGVSSDVLADVVVEKLGVRLDVKLRGKLLGPYIPDVNLTGRGFAHLLVKKFGSKYVKEGYRHVRAINETMDEVREEVSLFESKADNMSWATQNEYTRELSTNISFPTLPSNPSIKIPVTHIIAPKVENFVQRTLTAVHEQLKFEIDYAMDKKIDDTNTKLGQNLLSELKKRIHWELNRNLHQNIFPRVLPLDEAWANRSDLAVEKESQAGVKPSIGYDPIDPFTPFDTLSFENPDVAHLTIDFGQFIPGSKMKVNGGSREGHQISSIILGRNLQAPARPCIIPIHGYMARSTGQYNNDSTQYDVSFTVKGDNYYSGPLTCHYYFTSNDSGEPTLVNSSDNDMELEIENIGGPLYVIKATGNVTFNRSYESPEISFGIAGANGTKWLAEDDWSAMNNEIPMPNGRIVVYDSMGVKMSGLEPDIANDTLVTDTLTPFVPLVEAYSKERSWNNGNSQPSLAIKNIDTLALTGFDSYYYYSTPTEAELRVYWMSDMNKATWSVDTLNDTLYAVKVSYRDISISPNAQFNYIDFEINHTDWSEWNFANDPSWLECSILTLNENVCVTDTLGNVLWGKKLH